MRKTKVYIVAKFCSVKKIRSKLWRCDKLHVIFVVLKGSNQIGSPPLELEESRRFRSRRKRKLEGVFTSPVNSTTTNDLMPAIQIHMNGDDEVAPFAVLQSREDGDGENLKAAEVHQMLLPVDSSKGNQSPTTFGIKTKGILTPMEKGASFMSKTSSAGPASREESDSSALGIPSRWGDNHKSAGINVRTQRGHFSRDVRVRSTEFKEVIQEAGVHRRKVMSSSTSMVSMKMNKRTADRLNQRKSTSSAISIKDSTPKSCGWGSDRPQKKVQLVDITATLNDWSTTNITAQNACSKERAFQWSVDRGKSTSKNTPRLSSNGEKDPSSTANSHSTSDSEIDSDVEEFSLPTNAKEVASVVTTVTSSRTSENPHVRLSECRIKSTSVSSQKGNMGMGKDDAIVHGDGSTKRSSVVTDCDAKVGFQFAPPPVLLHSTNDSEQSHYSPTHPRRYPLPGKGDHHGLSTKYRDSRRRTLSKHRILQHKQEMMPLSRKKVVVSSTTSHQTVCEVIFHQRENGSYSAGHQMKTHDILLCWCATVQRQSNDESLPPHLTLVWTKNLSSVAREPGSRLVLHEPFFEIDSSHLPCKGLIALTGQSLLPSNSSIYVLRSPTSIEQSVEKMINLVRAKGLSYALQYFRQESNSQKVALNDKCGGELHYPCVAIARNEMKLFSGFLNELLFQEHRRYNVFAKLIRIYLHPSLLGSHLQSQCPGVTEIKREGLFSGPVPLFEDDASGILLIQLVHTRELAKIVIRGDVRRWINFYLSASEQFFLICGLRFVRLSCIDALSANVMRHMSTERGVSVSESRRLNKFTCALFDVDDATVHIERAPPCWRKGKSVIRVSCCRSLWLCMLSDEVRPPECESLSRQSFAYRRVTMLVSCQKWIKLQEFHRFCADEVECQSREDYRLHDVNITTSKDFACAYETSAKTRGAAPFHPYVQGYLFVSDQSLMFDSASKTDISSSNIYEHPLVIAVMSSALMCQIEALFANVSSVSGPLLMLHDVLVKQRQLFYEKESAGVAPKREDPQFCFPLLYADCFSSMCRIEEFNTMQSNRGLEKSLPDCRFGGELLIPSEILLPSSSRSESMCFISRIPLSNLHDLI
jgi:hypothetical protein